MTERDELLAYALQEGFASEDEIIELWENPDFFPDGYDEVESEPGFFDDVTDFLGAAASVIVNLSRNKVARMLADALYGVEGAVAVEIYQRVLDCIEGK